MKLVLVTWRDAHFSLEDGDDPDDYLVQTVGWEVDRSEHFLKLCSELLPDDDGWRARSRIPLESIVSIVPLTGDAVGAYGG